MNGHPYSFLCQLCLTLLATPKPVPFCSLSYCMNTSIYSLPLLAHAWTTFFILCHSFKVFFNLPLNFAEQGHALERSGEETVPLTAILPRVDTSSNVQSRIRKMESRRKEMLMELHSKSHLPPVQATQPSPPQQKGAVNLELKSETGRLVESDERLQEFASIAIGPQSPLLQNSAIDWDHAR